MAIYEHNYTVDYIDINENNELTTRNFIKFMQEIAGEHSSSVGYGLNELTKENKAWIILNWDIKIFERPHCKEKILIKTWVRDFDKIYTFRDFEVYDANNKLLAIASSKWVLKNHASKSIVRFTPELIDAYDCVDKSVFNYELNYKPSIPESFDSCFEYVIQRRDIDTNHHVNNLFYIDFAYEALPDDVYNNNVFSNIQVCYKKEIKYKEKISCCYSCDNGIHTVVIKNDDLSIVHAVVNFSNIP